MLRFSNDTYNAGDGPLILNATINPSTLRGPVDAAGDEQRRHVHRLSRSTTTCTGTRRTTTTTSTTGATTSSGRRRRTTRGSRAAAPPARRSTPARRRRAASPTRSSSPRCPNAVYPGQYGAGGCDAELAEPDPHGTRASAGATPTTGTASCSGSTSARTRSATARTCCARSPTRSTSSTRARTRPTPTRESVARQRDVHDVRRRRSGAILDSDPPTGTVAINHVDKTTASAERERRRDRPRRRERAQPVPPVERRHHVEDVQLHVERLDPDHGRVEPRRRDRRAATPTSGIKTVYAQVHDNSGKWGPTFTDTINLRTVAAAAAAPAAPADRSVRAGRRRRHARGLLAPERDVGHDRGRQRRLEPGHRTRTASTLGHAEPARQRRRHGRRRSTARTRASRIPSTGSISPANAIVARGVDQTHVAPGHRRVPVDRRPRPSRTRCSSTGRAWSSRSSRAAPDETPGTRVVPSSPGSTYHVVGTYDGSTQKLYINGALERVGRAHRRDHASTRPRSTIGSWDGARSSSAASIDEVAVYSHVAARRTQVSNHYTAGISTAPPPAQSQLSISRSGSGQRHPSRRHPPAINCGATCSAAFPSRHEHHAHRDARRRARPSPAGPAADCTGTGTCTLTLNANTSVDAAFDAVAHGQLTVTKSGTGTGIGQLDTRGHQLRRRRCYRDHFPHRYAASRSPRRPAAGSDLHRLDRTAGTLHRGNRRSCTLSPLRRPTPPVDARRSRADRRHSRARPSPSTRQRDRNGHLVTRGHQLRRHLHREHPDRHQRHAHRRARLRLHFTGWSTAAVHDRHLTCTFTLVGRHHGRRGVRDRTGVDATRRPSRPTRRPATGDSTRRRARRPRRPRARRTTARTPA